MSKKWIYEGEFRCLRDGDFTLGADGKVEPITFRSKGDETVASFPVVRPIPDDVVMVPREKIEALRLAFKEHPHTGYTIRLVGTEEQWAAARGILACAEPAKPKDEILEALRRCRNTMNRDRINCTTDIIQVTDAAIALRKKELKERGE